VTDVPAPLTPAEQRPALERPRRGSATDELALTALYEEHRGEVLGFLIRMTRDREAAEDLLQETFVRLITETRADRMPDNVRAWLFRVAANAAISRSRRRATLKRLVPRLLDRREPERPEGEYLRFERETELHAALAGLEPDTRAALLMGAQGFSGAEIAASIGRSESATRTLMCRARVALRLTFEAAEGPR
jgi:RNA polymerase sigma-70 factor (ECF subfamily)